MYELNCVTSGYNCLHNQNPQNPQVIVLAMAYSQLMPVQNTAISNTWDLNPFATEGTLFHWTVAI